MTKKEKLLNRFLSKPSDFKWNELVTLLRGLGYEEIKGGKTSGSRVAFVDERKHIIRLHKPHKKSMRQYQLDNVEEVLKEKGVIK